MQRTLLALAATLFMAACLATVARVLPPCPTEDSSWCFWDDGDGFRFVALWTADPAPPIVRF